MWQKPGGRAMRFTAAEEFDLGRVAFVWRARFPIAPLVAMNVVDEYAEGNGKLVARVLGIPVLQQQGPETSVGEALRYLAELPWMPQAMNANPDLQWRELDGSTVEVATVSAGKMLTIHFKFDSAGDIIQASSDARPRPIGKAFVATPWSGAFADYKTLRETRLPTQAEVRWELPHGRFVYWRGRVTSLEMLP